MLFQGPRLGDWPADTLTRYMAGGNIHLLLLKSVTVTHLTDLANIFVTNVNWRFLYKTH